MTKLTTTDKYNSFSPHLALLLLSCLLAFSAACNREASSHSASPSTAAKRYSLKGTVISIDKQAGTANINNEPISGFMDSMVMPYTIKPAATLDQLHPGDSVTADAVVESDKYWLENVHITARAQSSTDKAAGTTKNGITENGTTESGTTKNGTPEKRKAQKDGSNQ